MFSQSMGLFWMDGDVFLTVVMVMTTNADSNQDENGDDHGNGDAHDNDYRPD